MMIKVGDSFLDFDGDIFVDKQAKLFEEISTSNGDFSYSFSLEKTSNNLQILSFPLPDIKDKTIYSELQASLLNDDGLTVYDGFIRVDRINSMIECSFFSGNYFWFSQLTGNLSDLDFSSLDELLNRTNIISSFTRTENLKYLVADPGVLQKRGAYIYSLSDFAPVIFAKTLLKKCLSSSGFKADGELFHDGLFNRSTISLNDSNSAIDSRAVYANKNVGQVIPGSETVVTFDDDTTLPYYQGSQNNFNKSTGEYTADVSMILSITVTVTNTSSNGLSILLPFYINDVFASNSAIAVNDPIFVSAYTVTINLYLAAGEVLEMKATPNQNGDTLNNITLEIIPVFIFKTFVSSSLPKWTKQQFVSNIIKVFNVIPHYNVNTSTVTFNLFDKIGDKEPLDFSSYIDGEPEIDFVELISNYGKHNLFKYSDADIEEIDKYNTENDTPYASGEITVDNFYINENEEVLDLDFTAPYNYYNEIFKSNFEKLGINDYTESNLVNVTQVNNGAGQASLEVGSNYAGYKIGDLIRISDSTELSYNGDWIVEILIDGNSIKPYGMTYVSNTPLTVVKLIPKRRDTEDVYILADTGPLSITDYSLQTNLVIGSPGVINTSVESPSVAYFNLPDTGKRISTIFKQGLSFNSESFQMSLIEQYYKIFEGILNDPVKYSNSAYIPYKVFLQIDFLKPIRITSNETSNLYYLNKITGYINSYTPCTIELIKLP